jgi:hypothetical protein
MRLIEASVFSSMAAEGARRLASRDEKVKSVDYVDKGGTRTQILYGH